MRKNLTMSMYSEMKRMVTDHNKALYQLAALCQEVRQRHHAVNTGM